jgi:hypothetical protein
MGASSLWAQRYLYHWRGRDWRSLSVIAREMTGSRRNGPAFFGLARRAAP